MMYYVYMLRCEDGSLYTGITTDLARRFEEHRNGKGAKYTRSRGAVRIEAAWSCEEKGDALRLEMAIKKLPKGKKEKLAAGTGENLPASVSELIEAFFHRVEDAFGRNLE